ncbi:peptidylprolyl isomerase, partial [Perkinsus sp. BL_2016]
MNKYRLLAKKGEGTFSEVLKAQNIKTGRYVAMKCMKNTFDSIEQVNNLREVQALRRLAGHPHIIKLIEVLYDEPSGRLALVFELADMNLYEAIRGRRHYLPEAKVAKWMYQLLLAVNEIHSKGVFHRDLKLENALLIGDECLKLADLGSCKGIYSRQPYTEYISTRWYRAPECLLTDGYYSYKMDIWGVGCVFFELMTLVPLFPGSDELDQINKIHNVLGTPPVEVLDMFKKQSSHMDFNFPSKKGTGLENLLSHGSKELISLLENFLAYNPEDRLSARHALKHPYFAQIKAEYEENRPLPPPVNDTELHGNSQTSILPPVSSKIECRLPPIVKKPTLAAKLPSSFASLKKHNTLFSNSHNVSLAHAIQH